MGALDRPAHGGFPDAKPTPPRRAPIMLQIAKATDEEARVARRLAFLIEWTKAGKQPQFADRDGHWSPLTVLEYLGEVMGVEMRK